MFLILNKESRLILCLASGFVKSAATDITHPLDDIVVRIVEFGFEDFQVSNLQRLGILVKNIDVQ